MKILGALLVLWGAGGFYFQRRREALLPIRTARALLADLAVLRYQVCVCRAPLPEICTDMLREGLGAQYLWGPLGQSLQDAGEPTLSRCWAKVADGLPPPLDRLLAPLGPLLPVGGERLAGVIEETREELARFSREESARQAGQGRILAALCLSGACLVILVLI